MKPRITFVSGSDVLSTNNRDFSELPPINQEIEFRDERYKVVGYQDATVVLELLPEPQEEDAPRRQKKSPKAKRVEKKQAKATQKAKRAEKSKASVKTSTNTSGNSYNRR